MDEERYGRPVHIWTAEEILDQPDADTWFYGLVRQEDGSVTISEIYPGHGFCDFEISKDEFDERQKRMSSRKSMRTSATIFCAGVLQY